MDIDSTGDISSLDPELLQLPEFSPLALKPSAQIAEHLFAQWLSLPDTSRLVIYFLLTRALISPCIFVSIVLLICIYCSKTYVGRKVCLRF